MISWCVVMYEDNFSNSNGLLDIFSLLSNACFSLRLAKYLFCHCFHICWIILLWYLALLKNLLYKSSWISYTPGTVRSLCPQRKWDTLSGVSLLMLLYIYVSGQQLRMASISGSIVSIVEAIPWSLCDKCPHFQISTWFHY